MATEDDHQAQFRNTLFQVWIDNRMERDRAYLTLSAGGIGLLVTLLATVGPSSSWELGLYAAAGVTFFISTYRTIAVFEKNADHVSKVRSGDLDPAGEKELRRLDRLKARYFLWGVVFTAAIAVSTGVSKLNESELTKEEVMKEVRELRESLAGIAAQRPSSLDQKSLAGIAAERPSAPPAAPPASSSQPAEAPPANAQK